MSLILFCTSVQVYSCSPGTRRSSCTLPPPPVCPLIFVQVYELFTGRILVPGRDNNEMLKTMMEVKGPFTKKMLRRGAFVDKHFENDQNMSFALMEDDPITKTKVGLGGSSQNISFALMEDDYITTKVGETGARGGESGQEEGGDQGLTCWQYGRAEVRAHGGYKKLFLGGRADLAFGPMARVGAPHTVDWRNRMLGKPRNCCPR